MKADCRHSSPGPQAVGQASQCDFQRLQLVVYGNSQGLEGSRGRIDAVVPRSGDTATHQLGQLGRGFHGRLLPPLDDRSGNPPAIPLLAVVENQICQMLGAQSLQQSPSRFALHGIEPQIQRAGRGKTESALEVCQLIAGQTEVQQDSIHRLNPKCREDFRQVAKVGLHNPYRQIGKMRGGRSDGRRIAIQGNNPAARHNALDQGASMTPTSKGAIDENAAGLGGKAIQDFGQHYGHMNGTGKRHRFIVRAPGRFWKTLRSTEFVGWDQRACERRPTKSCDWWAGARKSTMSTWCPGPTLRLFGSFNPEPAANERPVFRRRRDPLRGRPVRVKRTSVPNDVLGHQPRASPFARDWAPCGSPSVKATGRLRTRATEKSFPPHRWKHTLRSEVDAASPVSGQWLPATVFPQVAIPQTCDRPPLHPAALPALLARAERSSDIECRFRRIGSDPL